MPSLTIGIVAMFVPYLYTLIPVYETEECRNFYISNKISKVNDFSCLLLINICSFIAINWSQVLILTILCYKIINIKDELNIKKELVLIIIIWITFSVLYFGAL